MKKKKKYYRGKIFEFEKDDNLLVKLKFIPFSIKNFFQRGRNGYARVDVWDIDYWFKKTLINMLGDLIEGSVSYPLEMKSHEEWLEILKYMRFCFMESQEETCSRKNEYDNYLSCGTDEQKNLWLKRDQELYEYRQKMQKEALNLFVKYFNSLWD